MGPPVSCGPVSASRCPLWTIDVATGVILDWNIPAARLCGWSRGGHRRSFGELSQLLIPALSARAKRITIAEVVRLARSRKKEGHGLETRLIRPGRRTRYLALDALVTGGQRRNESVLLIATLRRSVAAVDVDSGALSAIIGHELNNIAVPLGGYRDLALQCTPENEPFRECLDETRIAMGRLTALADELESLGDSESRPMQVPIGQCIPEATDPEASGPEATAAGATGPDASGDSPAERWTIDWLCGADTAVSVDRHHAQRSIRALIRVATRVAEPSPSLLVLTVAEDVHAGARCISCGAVVSRGVAARISGSHPVEGDALRNPFGARRVGLTRRLTLAVLVHCAHRAGGHLIFDKISGSPSVVFPAA
jgi:hypothetical protein